jgi:hypothetical protein
VSRGNPDEFASFTPPWLNLDFGGKMRIKKHDVAIVPVPAYKQACRESARMAGYSVWSGQALVIDAVVLIIPSIPFPSFRYSHTSIIGGHPLAAQGKFWGGEP